MRFNEEIIKELIDIQQKNECNLVEAAVEFCEINDIDIDDFVNFIDVSTVERLQVSALDNSMVRKKDFPKSFNLLDIAEFN